MNFADLKAYVASLPIEEREALDDEGLRIHDSLSPGGYDASPPGYLAFASTGGDGVHFSFPSNESGPVVMTVPMAFDRPNIVVGADLKEFLSRMKVLPGPNRFLSANSQRNVLCEEWQC